MKKIILGAVIGFAITSFLAFSSLYEAKKYTAEVFHKGLKNEVLNFHNCVPVKPYEIISTEIISTKTVPKKETSKQKQEREAAEKMDSLFNAASQGMVSDTVSVDGIIWNEDQPGETIKQYIHFK